MKCPDCGNEVDEYDRFCKNCGKRLDFVNKNNFDRGKQQFRREERLKRFGERRTAECGDFDREVLRKGNFYKYGLKVIFGAFVVFTLLFFSLNAGYGQSVYKFADEAFRSKNADDFLGRDEFVIRLIKNFFSNIDFVFTPSAVMVFLAGVGAIVVFSWLIVLLSKKLQSLAVGASCNYETVFIVFYILFAVADAVLIWALKYKYGMPVGIGPVALAVLAAVCVCSSIVIYLLRVNYFAKYRGLGSALHIKDL